MNIFDFKEEKRENELIDILCKEKNLRIERILSYGQTSDWMIQDEDEWVLVIKGKGILEFEDFSLELNPGESFFIKKGQKHRVSYTSKKETTLWLYVFVK